VQWITAIALQNTGEKNGGRQSLEHPSLGKSAAVLCLAEGLKKVILVFFSYNSNIKPSQHTVDTAFVTRFSQTGRNPKIIAVFRRKKTPKTTHQFFLSFFNLAEYLSLVP